MLDSVAYRASEASAKRAIADWRLANVNDPYIFENQGFPVRADSFLDLAQILDTMQEGRFDSYMREIGGLSDEDADRFLSACVDYIDFHVSCFKRWLSFAEMMAPSIGYAVRYLHEEEMKLHAVSNTPEEISEVVGEMLDRLDGTLSYTPLDDELQAAFDATAETNFCIGNARAGRAFLRRHSRLLKEPGQDAA